MDWSPDDLATLEVLVEVSRSRSFREAATKLGVSQAAVSIRLKALETKLGAPLFDEVGRRKTPNRLAQALCLELEPAMRELRERLGHASAHFQRAEEQTLRIAARPELIERLGPKLDFRGRLEFVLSSATEGLEQLRERRVDVAFSYLKIDSPDYMAWPVCDSLPCLVVGKSLVKSQASLAKLALDGDFFKKTPCLLYRKDDALLGPCLKKLGILGDQVQRRLVLEDWRALLGFVSRGYGYAFVPSHIHIDESQILKHEVRGAGIASPRYYALFRKSLLGIKAFEGFLRGLKMN